MNGPICGHDRQSLLQVLANLASGGELAWGPTQEGRRGVSFGPLHHLDDAGLCDAADAVHDPAKLVAIIAELMQAGEWHVYDDDPCDDLQLPAAEVFVDGDSIGLHLYRTWDDCRGEPPFASLTMPQARTFALRIINSPTATAQDIERMIGELS